ncbi:MAG TPA: DUF1189 family protein [Terriglobia bacterium]|nr:DUF1189 family protein [Terriglobia bacterium]
MRQHSVWDALILSFYSKPLYHDVAAHWRGTGFAYLLLLLALCWVPEMAKLQVGMTKWVRGEGTQIVKQIPPIDIKDGEVSTGVTTPYFIKDPEKGNVIAIIDLTGQYTSLENSPANMLLTKHAFYTRNSASEVRSYDLKNVKSFHLDQTRVQGWLNLAGSWLVVVLYPFALLFSFIYRIAQALIYGLCGLVISRVVKVQLEYLTLLRLAAVAVTPAVILETVRSVGSVHIPYWSLLCFLIAMGYLYFAVTATVAPEASAPAQPIA